MRKLMFGAAIMSLMFLGACKNEGKKDEAATVSTELAMGDMATFGVRGNCGMCKATIEKAATALEGVSKADWSVAKKQIAVTYDASKTNIEAIHQAIAAAGYDTEKATGNLGKVPLFHFIYPRIPLALLYIVLSTLSFYFIFSVG